MRRKVHLLLKETDFLDSDRLLVNPDVIWKNRRKEFEVVYPVCTRPGCWVCWNQAPWACDLAVTQVAQGVQAARMEQLQTQNSWGIQITPSISFVKL